MSFPAKLLRELIRKSSESRSLQIHENRKRLEPYVSIDAKFLGVHLSKRASGMTGESKRIFGRDIYGTFALKRINHSVKM